MATGISLVFSTIFVVFIATQAYYFVFGFITLALYATPTNPVPDRTPADWRPIDILIPLYQEPEAVVTTTLASIRRTQYPQEHLTIHLIYEEDDEVVDGYITHLRQTQEDGPTIRPVCVAADDPVWETIATHWPGGRPMPRNKARALNYALYTHDFDSVITVLDADTIIPTSLFRQGVAGLEDYDIVQAKQTVRNLDDGALPLLESAGMAAWCDAIYEHTATGPYQLLGKGYFADAEVLYALEGWDPYDATEDMALGIAAYQQGYELGVIDAYVQDLCPAAYSAWRTQKVRWVSGPYRALANTRLSPLQTLRFFGATFGIQSLSVVNLIGIPSGIFVLVFWGLGAGYSFSLPMLAIMAFNGMHWVVYSTNAYTAWNGACGIESVPDGCRFTSPREQLGYMLRANPIAELIYSTLWAIPIIEAFAGYLRGTTVEFTVTPKS